MSIRLKHVAAPAGVEDEVFDTSAEHPQQNCSSCSSITPVFGGDACGVDHRTQLPSVYIPRAAPDALPRLFLLPHAPPKPLQASDRAAMNFKPAVIASLVVAAAPGVSAGLITFGICQAGKSSYASCC